MENGSPFFIYTFYRVHCYIFRYIVVARTRYQSFFPMELYSSGQCGIYCFVHRWSRNEIYTAYKVPETIWIKVTKVLLYYLHYFLVVVTGNHEVDYKKIKTVGIHWYYYRIVCILVRFNIKRLATGIEILRIVNVAASVIVLLGVSFPIWVVFDEAFRTANMLEHSGFYVHSICIGISGINILII